MPGGKKLANFADTQKEAAAKAAKAAVLEAEQQRQRSIAAMHEIMKQRLDEPVVLEPLPPARAAAEPISEADQKMKLQMDSLVAEVCRPLENQDDVDKTLHDSQVAALLAEKRNQEMINQEMAELEVRIQNILAA